jgi:hypothetical protein
MSPRIIVGSAGDTCDIQTCGGRRVYWVGRLDEVRGVCRRCMEELVSVSGWQMSGAIDRTGAGGMARSIEPDAERSHR